MAKGNGAALGVDLVEVQAKLVRAPHALASKGLVDLEDVDVVLVDAGLLEDLGDGGPWSDTHEQGSHTDDRGGNVLAQDGLAEALSGGALHEEHGSSTVGDLGGVTGVDGSVLGECGADLAEALSGDARSDTVVLGDGDLLGLVGLGIGPLDLQGGEFLVEEAGLLSLESLLVAGSGELILDLTGDLAVLGHLFGQHAHGHLAVGGLGVRLEQFAELGDGARAILRAHALHASSDTDLNGAGLDRVGDLDAGL